MDYREIRMTALKYAIESFLGVVPLTGRQVLDRAELFARYIESGKH